MSIWLLVSKKKESRFVCFGICNLISSLSELHHHHPHHHLLLFRILTGVCQCQVVVGACYADSK